MRRDPHESVQCLKQDHPEIPAFLLPGEDALRDQLSAVHSRGLIKPSYIQTLVLCFGLVRVCCWSGLRGKDGRFYLHLFPPGLSISRDIISLRSVYITALFLLQHADCSGKPQGRGKQILTLTCLHLDLDSQPRECTVPGSFCDAGHRLYIVLINVVFLPGICA